MAKTRRVTGDLDALSGVQGAAPEETVPFSVDPAQVGLNLDGSDELAEDADGVDNHGLPDLPETPDEDDLAEKDPAPETGGLSPEELAASIGAPPDATLLTDEEKAAGFVLKLDGQLISEEQLIEAMSKLPEALVIHVFAPPHEEGGTKPAHKQLCTVLDHAGAVRQAVWYDEGFGYSAGGFMFGELGSSIVRCVSRPVCWMPAPGPFHMGYKGFVMKNPDCAVYLKELEG